MGEKGGEVFDSTAGPQLAFGLGPRGCYGRRMAFLQLRIFTVLLIWKFELLGCEGAQGLMAAEQKEKRQYFVRLAHTGA